MNELDVAIKLRVVGQVREDGSGATMELLAPDGSVRAARPATQQEVMMYSMLADMWFGANGYGNGGAQ